MQRERTCCALLHPLLYASHSPGSKLRTVFGLESGCKLRRDIARSLLCLFSKIGNRYGDFCRVCDVGPMVCSANRNRLGLCKPRLQNLIKFSTRSYPPIPSFL